MASAEVESDLAAPDEVCAEKVEAQVESEVQAESEVQEVKVSKTSSNLSIESIVSCRICKASGGQDLVPSPCNCKGSLGTVHVTCLEEWLTGSTRDSCELCSVKFNVVRTRKFGCMESLWIFLRDHVSGLKLARDVFFLAISVMNTAILTLMWLTYVFRDFLRFSGGQTLLHEKALAWKPVKGTLYLFFFTLCLMFVAVNTVDDFRRVLYFYMLPWYHWWQNNVDVKLVQEKRKTD